LRAVSRILIPLVLALTALAALAGTASATPGTGRTVFVLNDNPAGNQVVAYNADASGALQQAGVYSTGGLGGILNGSVVDHTASQGALAYDPSHNLLLASNPGNSTISVFRVNGDKLALTQQIDSGGTFPVSIAARDGVIYVLNALDGGSIQGFRAVGQHLFAIDGSHRDLGLGTTAASPFTATPGQVTFSPNGSQVLVTTKGSGNAIDVFSVDDSGVVSASPTVNVDTGAVPFAVAFDPSGNLAVAEAGTNSLATFSLAGNGQISFLSRAATSQAATCWVTATGSFLYVSNAGSASVTGFAAGSLANLGNTAAGGGTVDSAATPDGAFLYVQGGAAGIVTGYRIGSDGSLTPVGSVTVPGAAGAEGIVAL
jgi:6-phosphogluconolactonase (cycloisomerase 2 family)